MMAGLPQEYMVTMQAVCQETARWPTLHEAEIAIICGEIPSSDVSLEHCRIQGVIDTLNLYYSNLTKKCISSCSIRMSFYLKELWRLITHYTCLSRSPFFKEQPFLRMEILSFRTSHEINFEM